MTVHDATILHNTGCLISMSELVSSACMIWCLLVVERSVVEVQQLIYNLMAFWGCRQMQGDTHTIIVVMWAVSFILLQPWKLALSQGLTNLIMETHNGMFTM